MTTASASYTIGTPASSDDSTGALVDGVGQIEDHCEDGLAKLLVQFSDAARLRDLICTYLDETTEVEAAAWSVYTERTLDTATGAQLDGLGEIVRQERIQDQTDDQYRSFIRARIRALRSHGRADDLLDVLRLVIGPDASVIRYEERYPASAELQPADVLPADPYQIYILLRLAKPGGVRLLFIHSYLAESATFTFAPSTADSHDSGTGFTSSTGTPSTGGGLSSVIG